MGELTVRGSASKRVDYDLMIIDLIFHSKENTAKEASQKVMHECEEFLKVLEKGGVDISEISLSKDSVETAMAYNNDYDREWECYKANRSLRIESEFDMKMINAIRSITNNSGAQVEFNVKYKLSNEEAISQELQFEALRNAKKQAEEMAQAIDQKVIGLISADKNGLSNKELEQFINAVSMRLCCEQTDETYDHSDKLSSSNILLTETIQTIWEIA